MYRKAAGALALAASFSMAACGGGTDLDGELSEVEAEALTEALFSNAWSTAPDDQQPGAEPGAALSVPYSYSFDVEATAECDLGGTVDLEGAMEITGDSEVAGGAISYSLTQVHHDCIVQAQNSDRQFTVSGSPSMNVSFDMLIDPDGGWEVDGSMNGAVQWETEGRAGTCSVAVEYTGEGNADSETGAFSVAGSVCGATISVEASVG